MMKKILIVDDTDIMREMTAAMLEDGYETVGAASGAEALKIYEREKPDLILSDLVMPGMNGLEFQRHLQDKVPEHVPIIFISADESEENELRVLENGAVDFIRRPLSRDVLLQRVGNVLRQEEQIRYLRVRAETDPMTGLMNKAHVTDVLRERCQKAAGTLMIVDLDDFKLVNDLFGHSMGDRVLIDFAQIIKSVIRSSDIAGRIGGDEFIVFCQDVREEEIIAGKTRRMITLLLEAAKAAMGPDMEIPLGVSVGAVRVPDEGTDYDVLFPKADRALYRVKQNGKHGCLFFEGVRQAGEERKTGGSASTLKNVQVILEERNRARGAFKLGFEDFRNIYRFTMRVMESYHQPVELALFTLHVHTADIPAETSPDITSPANTVNQPSPENTPNQPSPANTVNRLSIENTPESSAVPSEEDVIEQFGHVLSASLRRSDVYTRNRINQYLVLLSGLDGENETQIFTRILSRWKEHPYYTAVDVTYETVQLSPSAG